MHKESVKGKDNGVLGSGSLGSVLHEPNVMMKLFLF